MKKKRSTNFVLASVLGLSTLLFGFDVWKGANGEPFNVAAFEDPIFDKRQISLTTKALSHDESKALLGRDILDRGYQPVQLIIQNNSSRTYAIPKEKISLPTVPADTIALKVMKTALPRAIGWKIASFLFWPLTIASTIDGAKSLTTYKKLKKELTAKTMKADEEIGPYSLARRVIFVPKEKYKQDFEVVFVDTVNRLEVTMKVKG